MAKGESQMPLIEVAPGLARRGLRFAWRWTRRVLKTLAALVALILTLLALLQLTEPGRALVLKHALEQTNALIPGRVEAKRLGRLSLMGIELWGLEVFDPEGVSRAQVKHLAVDTAWTRLLRGEIALDEVTIESAQVDLSVDEPARGLLAAFSEPSEEPAPEPSGPPPDIWVQSIRLSELAIKLPTIVPVGQLDLTVKALDARFALLDGEPDVLLHRLETWADRGAERLLSLEAEGALNRGRRASRLKLDASSGPVELHTDLEAVLPSQEGWEGEPLKADIALSGLTAAHLAEVLQDVTLAEQFKGDVGVELKATGSAQALQVQGAVRTAGGDLRIEKLHAEDESFDASFAAEDFRLADVRSDLPDRVVGLKLEAQVHGLPPQPVEASLSIRELVVDEVRLPDVDAGARWTGERAEKFTLKLVDGDSQLEAEGFYDISGEAEVEMRADLRPELVARLGGLVGQELSARLTANTTAKVLPSGVVVVEGRADVGDLRHQESTPEAVFVEQAAFTFKAEGKPPHLKGRIAADIQNARQGDLVLDQARLLAEGDVSDLSIELHAEGGQGVADPTGSRPDAAKTQVDLQLQVARGEMSTTIAGSGKGVVQGQAIDFDLRSTEISDLGGVQSDGLELYVAGQRLKLEGSLQPRGESEGLHLTFGPILVSELPQLMEVEPRLVGEVSGSVWVRGSTKIPRVSAHIQGKGLGFKTRPLAALGLDIEFDAEQGSAHSELQLHSARGLKLKLTTDASFPGGAQYVERLSESEAKVKLELETLESDFLNPYLPPGSLQFDAGMRSQVEAQVSMSALVLDADSEVELRIHGGEKLKVRHQLRFEEARVQTELVAQDAQGEWINATAHLDLDRESLPLSQIGAALATAASQAQWQTELTVNRRVLPELSVLSLFLDESKLPPFALDAKASGRHLPKQEPELEFAVNVEQAEAWQVGECSAQGLRLALVASHQEEQNQVRLSGTQGNQQLLELASRVDAALAPALAGDPFQLGAVSLDFETEELELASLPFVCGKAQGKLTASASGQDLMGESPDLSLQLAAKKFSLGSRHTLNVDLEAQAQATGVQGNLKLSGQGEHKDGQGEIAVELPWTWSQGAFTLKDEAPLQARLELHELPIAPLLPPRGALSYARGTVGAKVTAEGTLGAPRVQGALELHDVAFTSTALAQPLRDINARLSFKDRKIDLEHFKAHDREGYVALKGRVDLSDMKNLNGEIAIEAKDFPLRQQGQVVAVTNIRADAESSVTPRETRAVLHLHEVDTWLESVTLRSGIALEAHPDFVIDGQVPEGQTPAGPSSPEKSAEARIVGEPAADEETVPNDDLARVVYITIDADERFWVKREDFAVKLSTTLETKITDEAVRVQGAVEIDRGYLQLFGKIFELKRESRLRFIGSNPPNPVLELEAEHTTREGSLVAVRISGRADAPVLQFLLNGDPVDAGIAVQELFGGEESGGESDATNQAQSFVSGLTAGVLATAARRELGAAAPIVMIDPADKAGEGRVRAGFELDDIVPPFLRPIVTGVYLEGIVARESDGAAEANTQFGALLELYFPQNFFAAGQYGPGTTWSVDFGWQL